MKGVEVFKSLAIGEMTAYDDNYIPYCPAYMARCDANTGFVLYIIDDDSPFSNGEGYALEFVTLQGDNNLYHYAAPIYADEGSVLKQYFPNQLMELQL